MFRFFKIELDSQILVLLAKMNQRPYHTSDSGRIAQQLMEQLLVETSVLSREA